MDVQTDMWEISVHNASNTFNSKQQCINILSIKSEDMAMYQFVKYMTYTNIILNDLLFNLDYV